MTKSPRKPTLLTVAKQAKKAGIEVARYEIEPSGKIIVVTSDGDSADATANPWANRKEPPRRPVAVPRT